jgi:hypothetical protein
MARKLETGRYIISAGEIGAYTVCPEAWRLSTVERVQSVHAASRGQGVKLHKSWAQSFDDSIYFRRASRALLWLTLLTILIYILLKS